MTKKILLTLIFGIPTSIILSLMSCNNINTVGDSHFTNDGELCVDSSDNVEFNLKSPTRIKFYVEVSGSMNGFFRSNIPTQFKADVWQILSYYSKIAPDITILTNGGDMGVTIPMKEFQTKMNTGTFVSSASTQVPLMLRSIIDDLKADEGEVAVLISDMKYSPVGAAAPNVLLTQYTTDVGEIIGSYGKSVSLIGAISNYVDKSGQTITNPATNEMVNSPYYFFIIGNGEQVTFVRNDISSLLEMSNHFIDNIDSGIDYGKVTCSFGIPNNCFQLNDEPTFVGFEGDTCTIKMKIDLERYRWILTRPEVFKNSFEAKAVYGSNVAVGNIDFEENNITELKGKPSLHRKATAIVDLKVYDLAQDSEVIEWTLKLPNTNEDMFAPFFGATDENDISKSYSVDNFIKGMYQASVVNKTLKPSYILISKNQ